MCDWILRHCWGGGQAAAPLADFVWHMHIFKEVELDGCTPNRYVGSLEDRSFKLWPADDYKLSALQFIKHVGSEAAPGGDTDDEALMLGDSLTSDCLSFTSHAGE